MKKKIIALFLLSFVLISQCFSYAIADDSSTTDILDKQLLEEFIDTDMAKQMEEQNIPAVTISIVQNGEVLLSKGYGYQDLENEILTSGYSSMFSIGSISKLFVFTSIMQLVEQGILDLDANINNYLDFDLYLEYDKPITLYHLINHTAGFEEIVYQMSAFSVEKMQPLGDWLKTHQPKQILPPGEKSAYSNYGIALAAYIIESQSGMPYSTYIEENIFEPLSMNNTVIDAAKYNDFEENIAKGYSYNGKTYIIEPEEYYNIYPAGGIKSTSYDMSIFMMALLNDGEYDGVQILKPETAQEMFSPTFTPAENVSGLAHGFWEGNYKGIEYIGHGGDTMRFHSKLTLIKNLDLGIFISCSQASGYMLPYTFAESLLDEFYSELFIDNNQPKVDVDLNRFTGTYTTGRSAYTTNTKIMSPLTCLLVKKSDTGNLQLNGDTFIPIGELLFKNAKNDSLLVFTENEKGKIENLYFENAPAIYYYKDNPLNNSLLLLSLTGFFIIVFILSIIIYFVVKAVSLISKKPINMLFGLSALNSVFALLPVSALVIAFLNQVTFTNGELLFLKVSLVFPFVFVVSFMYFSIKSIQQFKSIKSKLTKVYFAIIMLSGLVYVHWCFYFNQIGWRFI